MRTDGQTEPEPPLEIQAMTRHEQDEQVRP
jgi:hypothetical protein